MDRLWGRASPIVEAVLKRFIRITTVILCVAVALPLAAQEGREPQPRVPEAFVPPAGMCRLWIDGVPASQQPAPTDCANAIRNRPSNASVVFGPQRRGETMELRSFTGRGVPAMKRQIVPNGFTSRSRDEARSRDESRDRADTTAKSAPRKPEKPQ